MNFRTLDLNLLRVFDAVMAERNLTRAAQRLAMTQPAVSHALKRLKEALGEDLFKRQAFGVLPSAHAESLWPEVRTALNRLSSVLAPTEFDPQADEMTVHLAMADATAAMLLPPLMLEFERLKALTNIRVLPLATRDPRRLLEQGEADCALGYFPAAVAALVSQAEMAPIHHHRLYESEYVCVMRHDHPLADLPMTLDRFCAAQHLLVSFSGRAHGFVDEALAGMNRGRRIVLTVNQFFTAGRVVANSDLLTVLPASFVGATGYKQQLVQRPLPMPLSRVHVEMLWHLRHDNHPGQRWLRERLIEAASHALAVA